MAPGQRTPDSENAIAAGWTAPEIWAAANTARKEMDRHRTVGHFKARSHADGSKPVNRTLPTFGDTSHISIAPQSAITRRQIIGDPARHDGAHLREGAGSQDLNGTQGLGRSRLARSRKCGLPPRPYTGAVIGGVRLAGRGGDGTRGPSSTTTSGRIPESTLLVSPQSAQVRACPKRES
ncbi:transposase [Rhodovulum sulfidophilum]|uniref:Transposase n=1 Tax=Rhodovulum sulfidophilum TaxID=35806 RepID=A0A0D6AZI5_RHOSU|nr:transposase [Rhodovulum sulfidophilum]